MAITNTTLAAPVAASDLSLNVASATGFLRGRVINIDNEWFVQSADAVGTVIPVIGGQQGSYRRTHNTGALVSVGDGADFPSAPQGQDMPQPAAPSWTVEQYAAAGAIALPTTKKNVRVILSAGSAAAMTLAAPPLALQGTVMQIEAAAAQAYTVTNTTPGFNNGSTASDVATFGGGVGNSFEIVAYNGIWLVLNLNSVTLG